jgi:hypothetical protein
MPIKGPHVIHHDSGTIGRCTQLDGDMIEHTAATIAVSGAASSRPHNRLPITGGFLIGHRIYMHCFGTSDRESEEFRLGVASVRRRLRLNFH